ncbi:hypothetical protein P7C73_g4554, partial [Tremellales sp. Uapishka_1]
MNLTGPGFAKDFVSKVPPPDTPHPFISYTAPTIPPPSQDLPASHIYTTPEDPSGPDPSELAPVANMLRPNSPSTETSHQPSTSTTIAAMSEKRKGGKKGLKDWKAIERPLAHVDIGPRWCRYCEINKPNRTHHCRHCGTCVLGFDHHCMYIGGCVGALNHKFFITFNFWALCFTLYIFIFLIIHTIKSNSVDPEVVVILAISGLFVLFTILMLPSHIQLILAGMTTVESYRGREQHEVEEGLLQKEYGFLRHISEKRRVRRKWKEEWGGSRVDGRWRFGSKRELWEREMGTSVIGWILPIGKPLTDGIDYPSSRKFGPNGEWLRKRDWPEGVV